ncbi:MAG: hypothetical protein R3314_04195 [Longimicrobiales bacterium]|nr:hypothetical protein [Longimicrobiales bacterium]
MARKYVGNELEWRVILSDRESRPGMVPVVFHCTSNTSFGWRVAEVPVERFAGKRAEDLTDEELDTVFAEAQPFGAPRDPKASESAIGHTPTR